MKKYLIVLTDLFENYREFFKAVNSNEISVVLTDLSSLSRTINELNDSIYSGNTIIAINHELINIVRKDQIHSYFISHHKISKPHILYCFTSTEGSEQSINKIISDRDFTFFMPSNPGDISYIINLTSFLVSAYSQILTEGRINNYIVESFKYIADTELIKQQKENIQELYENIVNISKIDFLTNILNRKAIVEILENESKRTMRDLWRIKSVIEEENPDKCSELLGNNQSVGNFLDHYGVFSVLMIDIDFFKNINDLHGHLVGDNVLRIFGDILKNHRIFREVDSVGRYGGEEFLVLLPETNARNAVIPAERLRRAIESHEIKDTAGDKIRVTISVGISEFYPEDITPNDLLSRADKALYHAKLSGRNKVVIYEDYFKKLNTGESSDTIKKIIETQIASSKKKLNN